MDGPNRLSTEDRTYLRDLALRQLEAARKPVMAERARRWTAHNRGTSRETMVVMEENTFWADCRPPRRFSEGYAAWLEDLLLHNLFVHEKIDDDKVIPDFIPVAYQISQTLFGLPIQQTRAQSGVGFHIEPVITDLAAQVDELGPTEIHWNPQGTQAQFDWVGEMVGDLLPPKLVNTFNQWGFGLSYKVTSLMGMEAMLFAMVDEPEAFHRLMRRITDDLIAGLRWQEEQHVLPLNNGNDYMGSGSFCFSDELPRRDVSAGEVRSTDTWGHVNSQESVGISPAMYAEFVLPYYMEIAQQFGLVYYGCCEAVDPFWDAGLARLPNLRKISISAWCDEAFMAERLAGSGIIYSRKPSPNFIGVQREFDEPAFRQHIQKTMDLTRDLPREVIFRDIYQLHGNVDKVARAVAIVRELAAR